MFQPYLEKLSDIQLVKRKGKITKVIGLTLESSGPASFIGEICKIYKDKFDRRNFFLAEVIGFKENRVIMMPFSSIEGISPGSIVEGTGEYLNVELFPEMTGYILNGIGRPVNKEFVNTTKKASIHSLPPDPLKRKKIQDILQTGIRVIDLFLTVGKGQRVGIFSGSGVGKSTILGMMARNSKADVNVIALIGERGREVREFIERDLGEEGLKKSVVVIATSSDPPLVRLKGAYVATTIAEYFRDAGKDVLFLMDSVTRFALAQREIGLAVGEPPATRGYTPSVFSMLPTLLERTGTGEKGAITAFYSVLVEGDDLDEPISDTVRGVLDGHVVLSRALANRNHFPAVDVMASVSRLMPYIVDPDHWEMANNVKDIVVTYKEAEDLINLGAYQKGNNPKIDNAIDKIDEINGIMKQGITEDFVISDELKRLKGILE
ncbi:FliI/YscN family ATPase [bacterium]|nr:FliI/YscN family ATPase [bacterium]